MLKRFCFILAFLIYSSICNSQETGCFKLRNNEPELETNIDFSKYRAFFIGESHGVYGIIGMKLALIKYLNTFYGANDVFMEISFSSAWLYNRYLETGDTTLFTAPMLVYAMKQPNRDFWKSLYLYNKTTTHKIVIHGMDFERMDFLKALKLLMPAGMEKPHDIIAMLTYIDTVTIKDVNNDIWAPEHRGLIFNNLYDSVKTDIENNREAYSLYYGGNFKMVEKIMFNENTFRKYDERNKTMYHNMVKEMKEYRIKKFITFNGLMHGNKAYAGWRSLCYRLEKNRAFKNKLATMAVVCKDCYDWQLKPAHRNAAYRAPYTYLNDTSLLNNLFDHYFNTDCKYTLLPSETSGDKKVEKFSDFLILMKDQGEF